MRYEHMAKYSVPYCVRGKFTDECKKHGLKAVGAITDFMRKTVKDPAAVFAMIDKTPEVEVKGLQACKNLANYAVTHENESAYTNICKSYNRSPQAILRRFITIVASGSIPITSFITPNYLSRTISHKTRYTLSGYWIEQKIKDGFFDYCKEHGISPAKCIEQFMASFIDKTDDEVSELVWQIYSEYESCPLLVYNYPLNELQVNRDTEYKFRWACKRTGRYPAGVLQYFLQGIAKGRRSSLQLLGVD